MWRRSKTCALLLLGGRSRFARSEGVSPPPWRRWHLFARDQPVGPESAGPGAPHAPRLRPPSWLHQPLFVAAEPVLSAPHQIWRQVADEAVLPRQGPAPEAAASSNKLRSSKWSFGPKQPTSKPFAEEIGQVSRAWTWLRGVRPARRVDREGDRYRHRMPGGGPAAADSQVEGSMPGAPGDLQRSPCSVRVLGQQVWASTGSTRTVRKDPRAPCPPPGQGPPALGALLQGPASPDAAVPPEQHSRPRRRAPAADKPQVVPVQCFIPNDRLLTGR